MPSRPWWQKAAIGLVILSAAAPFAARLTAGPPGGRVHVRWQPSVDLSARQHLESQFRLLDPVQLDEETWRYDLADPRPDAIRAIVRDAAVADTHDINREAYALEAAAVRTSRRLRFPGGDLLVSAADTLSAFLAVVAALIVAIGAAGHGGSSTSAARYTGRAAVSIGHRLAMVEAPAIRWLQRGIPEVDARTAGIFRIVFGLAVLMFFRVYAVDAMRLASSADAQDQGALHAMVLQWLRARPSAVGWIWPWMLVTGIAFTAGFLTRLSFALFVAAAIAWGFVAVTFDSTHPHSTLLLTLLALLPARWGDSVSVDAWLKRTRALPPGTRYGYTVWVPGLIVGVAFAAAAWAKLTLPGGWTDWVMNGTVKYHFITDSMNAPVDWGLRLAAHPQIAVLASLGAVAVEALVITAAFARSERYRLAAGLAAFSLIAGFLVFMGVLWLGWWIPLLGFLPWQRISALNRPNSQLPTPQLPIGLSARLVPAAQAAMIVFLLGQQIVVSALAIERAPIFTNYPMYAYTFAGPAEFNAWLPPVYRIVLMADEGRIELRCRPNGGLAEELDAAVAGSVASAAAVWRAVGACDGNVAQARGVLIEEDRRLFDWERQTLTVTPAAAVHGPLIADAPAAAATGG
jgi:hypothetical protein